MQFASLFFLQEFFLCRCSYGLKKLEDIYLKRLKIPNRKIGGKNGEKQPLYGPHKTKYSRVSELSPHMVKVLLGQEPPTKLPKLETSFLEPEYAEHLNRFQIEALEMSQLCDLVTITVIFNLFLTCFS